MESASMLHRICMDVIKVGCTPNHVALILDGNRRYATRMKRKLQFGHEVGATKLLDILKFVMYFGIRYVTVYAFSIENFKRSPEEVKYLFALADEKIRYFFDNIDTLRKCHVCVNFVGNASLVPRKLYKEMCKLHLETRSGAVMYLNVAFAYTSRDEITASICTICKGIQTEAITPNDVDEDLLNSCTYMCNVPKVDLLIRTSGEVRLSDFLLLQSADALIIFLECTWPEFSFWKFVYCILKFQRSTTSVGGRRKQEQRSKTSVAEFLKKRELDMLLKRKETASRKLA